MSTSYDPFVGRTPSEDRQLGEVLLDPSSSDSETRLVAQPDEAVESGGSSAVDDAKAEARGVASSATDAGARVAAAAKGEAATVTAEAGRQARDLFEQTRQEASDQVGAQQQRAATGLRKLTAELSSMADSAEQPGVGSDLTRQAAARVETLASWLDERAPGDVLEDVKSFARQRPGAFLALAAGAGLLAGRLTRGLSAEAQEAS